MSDIFSWDYWVTDQSILDHVFSSDNTNSEEEFFFKECGTDCQIKDCIHDPVQLYIANLQTSNSNEVTENRVDDEIFEDALEEEIPALMFDDKENDVENEVLETKVIENLPLDESVYETELTLEEKDSFLAGETITPSHDEDKREVSENPVIKEKEDTILPCSQCNEKAAPGKEMTFDLKIT